MDTRHTDWLLPPAAMCAIPNDVSGGPKLQISMRPTVGVDRWRIALAGELDVDSSPQLVEAVSSALSLPGCRDVIVDLGQVTFADASAVNALVRARLACRYVGGRFTVFGARGAVAEILYLTGVAESFGLPNRRSRLLDAASDR